MFVTDRIRKQLFYIFGEKTVIKNGWASTLCRECEDTLSVSYDLCLIVYLYLVTFNDL